MYSRLDSYESKPNTCFIIERHIVNWPALLPCISPKDTDIFNCHDLSPYEPVFAMTITEHVIDTDKHDNPHSESEGPKFSWDKAKKVLHFSSNLRYLGFLF